MKLKTAFAIFYRYFSLATELATLQFSTLKKKKKELCEPIGRKFSVKRYLLFILDP